MKLRELVDEFWRGCALVFGMTVSAFAIYAVAVIVFGVGA